jgi:N-acyl-L-homoserine lactone synthetase
MSVVVLRSEQAFSDRLSAFTQAVDIRRADTDEDREAIFRLRYEAYLSEGAIEPNTGQRFSDRFDETENVWLFGVHFEGALVSSIRIHVVTAQFPESPTVETFADILLPELKAGRVIVDPSRFVADRVASRARPEIPYVTARIAVVAMQYFSADIGVVAVRNEHRAFYRKVFQFTPVAPPRKYHGLTKPLGLMMARQEEVRDRVLGAYPFLRSTLAERRHLFGPLADERFGKTGAEPEPEKIPATA